MHYIEVRYLSLIAIVNLLHARVNWFFQGGASFVDNFCNLCFMLVFAMASCLFLSVLRSLSGKVWSLGSREFGVWLLCVSCDDGSLLLYFD